MTTMIGKLLEGYVSADLCTSVIHVP